MSTRPKRVFAAMSSVGAAVFVGLFAWMYSLGMISVEVFVTLGAVNLIVGAYSLKLAINVGE